MFKVRILQTLYNLADEAVESQIRDRLSFARYLGLELELIKPLFDRFGDYLAQAGLEARDGQIIDASIIPVPIQRNCRDENRRIKDGEVPEDWDEHKARQKDTDTRWTNKHRKRHFGGKNHIGVDAEHTLIRDFEATAANVRDSQVFDDVLDPDNADPAGLGRQRLPQRSDRGRIEWGRLRKPHLREVPEQPTAHRRATSSQPSPLQGALARRARLRIPAKHHRRQAHPHHRQGTGGDQDRLHEPRLQPDALPPAHQVRG